jgi:glycosyltransferase involved in cell wall biosynthesis
VLPSLAENLPVAILEAFACGKPVIATRVGGVPDVLTNGVEGTLVDAGDAEALARALVDAWQHPAEWMRRGKAAHERFLEEFACDAVAARVEAMYDECLGTPLAPRRLANAKPGSSAAGMEVSHDQRQVP